MDEKRNNRSVERRLKESLKHDRARIQVGRISHFGLLEMSRQRIRTSVLESSTDKCPHCGGTGHVRSVASVALQELRMIEETLLRGGTHNLLVRTRSDIAIYVLNHKRAHLRDLEERFRITITINADPALGGQTPFMIERGELVHSVEQAKAIAAAQPAPAPLIEAEYEEEPLAEGEEAEETEGETEEEAAEGEEFAEGAAETEEREETRGEAGGEMGGGAGDGGHRRRRRRRRGRRGEAREGGPFTPETAPERAVAHSDVEGGEAGDIGDEAEPDGPETAHAGPGEPREHGAHLNGNGDGERRRRRRGRRGGRRNRREGEERVASDMPQGGMHETLESPEPAGTIEPELADAVADFGGPPIAHETPEPATPHEPPTHQGAVHAEPPEPEAPRRRSTVREPVPFSFDEGTSALAEPSAPAPIAPAPAAPPAHEQPDEDAGKPRRTGWWAKRMLGG
jgi:ribonuclease E